MRLLWLITAIVFPIIIITTNTLFLVFNKNFYYQLYQKEDVYQDITAKRAQQVTIELINYFRGQNNLEDNFFSNQARTHLSDVRSILWKALALDLISALTAIIVFIYFIKSKKPKVLKKSIIIGSITTLLVVIIITISLFLNFDFIFIKFHELLFTNNYWLFPETDTLINLFPQKFFVDFAKQLSLDIILSCILIIFCSKLIPVKNDQQR